MRLKPSRKRDGDDALFVFCEQAIGRWYRAAARAIPHGPRCKLCLRPFAGLGRHAVIDKLIGDELMALFIPAWFPSATTNMVRAGENLLDGVGVGSGEEPWLPLGIGLDYGVASVGNVGTGEVKDFTAIGDVVNTAARLQQCAKAGQLVMSERVRANVEEPSPEAAPLELQLKGKVEPVQAWVVSPGSPGR